MESFNKNWLAIILIVIVFTAIGFLFGHMMASHHGNRQMDKMMFLRHSGSGSCCGGEMDDAAMWTDSLRNVDVKVLVNTGNGDDTCKKVIVKKIIKEVK